MYYLKSLSYTQSFENEYENYDSKCEMSYVITNYKFQGQNSIINNYSEYLRIKTWELLIIVLIYSPS